MKVAILGYGTVGSGVFEVINSNPEGIARRAGRKSKSSMCWICGSFREIRSRRCLCMILSRL